MLWWHQATKKSTRLDSCNIFILRWPYPLTGCKTLTAFHLNITFADYPSQLHTHGSLYPCYNCQCLYVIYYCYWFLRCCHHLLHRQLRQWPWWMLCSSIKVHIYSEVLVEGVFSLELTWVLTPFPQKSFGWVCKLRSSLCTLAFHHTDTKDPDIHS